MKLEVTTKCCVSIEDRTRNISLAPDAPEPSGSGHLAVIGGGPSINKHLHRIKHWDGDIWAVNGTYKWCIGHGIDAWFYTVDPLPAIAPLIAGAAKAIVADHSDPSVFSALDGADFKIVSGKQPGPTSAVASSVLGLRAGYSKVTYFGCESSYGDTCHAYPVPPDNQVDVFIMVKCGPQSYLTKIEFLLQAEQLADVIRTFPDMFSQVGGGLLEALIKYTDHDITHGSKSLHDEIKKEPVGVIVSNWDVAT